MPGLVFQWLSCSRDDAIADTTALPALQSGGGARSTWAPLPSPMQRAERYAISQADDPEITRHALQQLRREYEEIRDQLEKESRLAQSRAKVALKIHAREQGLQRNIEAALGRAKHAEEEAWRLRHENVILRNHIMQTTGCSQDELNCMVDRKVQDKKQKQTTGKDSEEKRRARWIHLNSKGRGKKRSKAAPMSVVGREIDNPYEATEPAVQSNNKTNNVANSSKKRVALEDISNSAVPSAQGKVGSYAEAEEIMLVF